MKIATLKFDILKKDSGKHTFNGHHLEQETQYQVLSDYSRVMGFPYILIHPIFANIYLVDIDCMNFSERPCLLTQPYNPLITALPHIHITLANTVPALYSPPIPSPHPYKLLILADLAIQFHQDIHIDLYVCLHCSVYINYLGDGGQP